MPLSQLSWILLTTLAGLLFTLAFAPFDYAYSALIALTILFLSWQQATPLQAIIRGYCFGLGSFSLGVTWVFVSIYFYGNTELWIAALLSESFAAFYALFPALAGYLCVKLAQINPANRGWLMPFIWIFVEYLRGQWFLNGFPWLQIAYSQLDSAYAGFMPLLGVYGTGFLIAFTAALLAYLIHFKENIVKITAIIATLFISGFALKNMSWTEKAGDSLQVTLIQGNISQDEKWQTSSLTRTLWTYQLLTYQHWDSDLIVWPETSIPAYLSQVDSYFLQPLAVEASIHQTDIIVSLLEKDPETNAVYNSALVLGTERGIYRKNHLLPFGEYMPLQPFSGWVLDNIGIRLDDFTAGGNQQPLLKAAGYALLTSICYEDVFGSANRDPTGEAAYLVNLTNDAWFGRSFEPYQHLQMARMRALETGRYLLRATNTGITALVAPSGKIMQQAPLFEAATLTGDIVPMRGVTPYTRIGDRPIFMVLAGLFVGVCFFRRKHQ